MSRVRGNASGTRRGATPVNEGEVASQQERINQLQQEKQDLLDDKHAGLEGDLAKLMDKRKSREGKVDRMKEMRIKYIQYIYEAEMAQIEDEFQADQRENKQLLLDEISKKMTQLNKSGANKPSVKRRRVGEGDTMRAAMLECNERLMNLDYVISDDEIRADVQLIYKNLEKLKKSVRKSGSIAARA